VLSDDAFSVIVPILEDLLGRGVSEIRTVFESNGLTLEQWDKARTDRVTIRDTRASDGGGAAAFLSVSLVVESVADTADAMPDDESAVA